MDKTLQTTAWNCLPKEFKEEVKKEWQTANNEEKLPHDAFLRGCYSTMVLLFGHHNLTSDAEGEEMLTVSRKKVQEMYVLNEDILFLGSTHTGARLLKAKPQELFGSKCLPDKACNVASTDVASSKPKPAEPKYHVGDIVRFKHCCTPYRIDGFKMLDGAMLYQVGEVWAEESDLEPDTEPTAAFTDDCKSQCKSQNQFRDPAKMVIQPETSEPTFIMLPRLKIAAMAMQGMLSNTTLFSSYEISDLVRISLNCADALIAECEKGGEK